MIKKYILKKLLKQNLHKVDYNILIKQINDLEENVKLLTDSELKEKTFVLEQIFKEKKDLKPIIAESFALVRESSRRRLGLRHYDVQLLGGLVLNEGKIAEMQTGEGKTIVATLPAYLNSLTKKSVQIVTVNDYLAKRDYNSISEIFYTLGLNTGLIQENFSESQRQQNYKADVTYVTNSELGFDYLRDNLTFSKTSIRLPKFNFCIVDEIDSILIDEAQTPLIMSSPIETSVDKYITAAQIVKYLELNKDFQIDEKNGTVVLTEEGSSNVKKILNLDNLYDLKNPWIPYLLNAIKAQSMFLPNIHYIIENNQVIIVDEFTGRISPDRKWSEGLHQAIQAKENLFVEPTTEIIASITYQNLFLLYPKLAGMTGTAKTSEVEFDKIFKLSVNQVPTAKPSRRLDLPDLIYRDEFTKWRAVINQSKLIALNKQPILIGTKTIEQSEMLSYLLNEYNLHHEILNAKPKNVRNEADIVALAGEIGRITIATNMAGRGTDIILGGNLEYKVSNKLVNIILLYDEINLKINLKTYINILLDNNILKNISQKFLSSFISLKNNKNLNKLFNDIFISIIDLDNFLAQSSNSHIELLINELYISEKKIHKLHNQFIQTIGGLFVIGTERNDSRRIDNQLRGRCGRQGEPGTSQFFLSLEDKLLRLFAGQNIKNLLKNDDTPLESNILNKVLDSAQNKLEEISFGFRKNLVEYDEAVNSQRNTIYFDRKEMLENNVLNNKLLLTYGEQIISEFVDYVRTKNLDFSYNDTIGEIDKFFGTTLLFDLRDDLNKNINDIYSKYIISKNPLKFNNKYLLYINKYTSNRPINDLNNLLFDYITNYLFEEMWLIYESKKIEREIYGTAVLNLLEQTAILWCLDILWQEHLHLLVLYRDAVFWRSYGQRDPLFEYKREIFLLYISQLQTFRQIIIFTFIRSYSI